MWASLKAWYFASLMPDVITNLLIFLQFSKACCSITRSETPSSNIMFCRLSQLQNAFLPIVLTDCGITTLVTPAGKHIKVSFALLYKAVPSDSKYLLLASTKIDFKALQPEKMLLIKVFTTDYYSIFYR